MQQQRSNASQPSEMLLFQGNEQVEQSVRVEDHQESIVNINAINELRQRSDDEENVSDHNAELGEPETYDVESFIDAIRDYVCIWNAFVNKITASTLAIIGLRNILNLAAAISNVFSMMRRALESL